MRRETPRMRRRRYDAAAHDAAWHDAQMAQGSLGPDGYIRWAVVEYEAMKAMTETAPDGTKAPDHREMYRRAWRRWHKLNPD